MQATPTAAAAALPPGAIYAGTPLNDAGQPTHHVILLADRPEQDLTWQAAMQWAASVGGDLPTPQEQALLFANRRASLPKTDCWSNKEHEKDASYAWFCYFHYGYQVTGHKSAELSAVAVRRLPLESFNPFVSAPSEQSTHVCTKPAAGTFTHTPRPAIVPKGPEYANQRRYGPGKSTFDFMLKPASDEAIAMGAGLEVYRDGETDLAEVRISLGAFTGATIAARLNAAELRELAARLIDAAHDIETLPATVLARAQEGGAA